MTGPSMTTNWEHFASRIVPQPDGCWRWVGTIQSEGYGIYGKVPQYAHRMSYIRGKGAIPPGMWIDHLCRNRACVNPAHLEAVAPRENTLRGMSRGAVSIRTGRCIRAHQWTPENTYVRPDGGGRQCRACVRLRTARKAER